MHLHDLDDPLAEKVQRLLKRLAPPQQPDAASIVEDDDEAPAWLAENAEEAAFLHEDEQDFPQGCKFSKGRGGVDDLRIVHNDRRRGGR